MLVSTPPLSMNAALSMIKLDTIQAEEHFKALYSVYIVNMGWYRDEPILPHSIQFTIYKMRK